MRGCGGRKEQESPEGEVGGGVDKGERGVVEGKTRCFRGECRKEERKGVGWWVGEQWKTWSQLIAPSFHGNTRPFPPTPVSFSPLSLPHPLPHFLHIFRSVFPFFVCLYNHVTRLLWPPFSSSFLSHLLLLSPFVPSLPPTPTPSPAPSRL